MEPSQPPEKSKPRVLSVTVPKPPSITSPSVPQNEPTHAAVQTSSLPQPPAPPAIPTPPLIQPRKNEENPLVKAMQEEALRDINSPSPTPPPTPRVIQLQSIPATTSRRQMPSIAERLSGAELREKIDADQNRRQQSLSNRITEFFGNLFKPKPKGPGGLTDA